MHNSKIVGSSYFPFILYLSVFYSNMLFLCNNFQKPRRKLSSCTVKHKPCSHSWKHLVYHQESTVYNILSLWRHEQILLIMLRFKKYLSWDVTSLNICSWRDQLFILGKLERNYGFCQKNKFLFIEDNSIHSFYWKVKLITHRCSSFFTLFQVYCCLLKRKIKYISLFFTLFWVYSCCLLKGKIKCTLLSFTFFLFKVSYLCSVKLKSSTCKFFFRLFCM